MFYRVDGPRSKPYNCGPFSDISVILKNKTKPQDSKRNRKMAKEEHSRSRHADDKKSELANERYNVFFIKMFRVLVKVSYVLEKIMNFNS